uniref:IncF plasmid conjugative transfer protein TraG n=1 Tax=Klebsiella pneumoniae TaxID=573 RepID=A0A8B0SZ29_KLEPN|nr:IncF plasmid conjugative transfer protein TraG [Klebsiella pneumoniae]
MEFWGSAVWQVRKVGQWFFSAEVGGKGSAGWGHSSGNTDNVGTSGRGIE